LYSKKYLWKIQQEKQLLKELQESRYKNNYTEEKMQQMLIDLDNKILNLKKITDRRVTNEEIKEI
jgi:hypothetical protein